jgi:hypothetical protein
MTNLKRSFFGAAIFLAVIFVLGEADNAGRPIINFASYFYVAVLVSMPLTLFFPFVSRVPVFVSLGVWAGVYLALLLTLNRRLSTNATDFSVIALEFILLEAGVWISHQLALQISHAESLMDALAVRAFPNRVRDIDSEGQRIKIELTRSRRYRRPLSLLIMEATAGEEKIIEQMLKSVQRDLLSHFTSARVAQMIDDRIRQTDLVLRDYRGKFIIVCPETDSANAALLAKRISQAIQEKTDLRVFWGVAAFPEEALTFDDLLEKARDRLLSSTPSSNASVSAVEQAMMGKD